MLVQQGSLSAGIKICLASWKRVLPDYKVHVWTYEDAKAIGCKYIDQALSVRNGHLRQM